MMKRRFGIQKKAVGAISLLLVLLAVSLMSISLYNDTRAIRSELLKRGRIAADNLAHNAVYATVIEDTTALADFLDGVIAEKEVLYSSIVDTKGQLLVQRCRNLEAQESGRMVHEGCDLPIRSDTIRQVSGNVPSAVTAKYDEDEGVVHFRVPIRMSDAEKSHDPEFGLYDVLGGQPTANGEARTIGYARIGMTTRYIDETVAELRNTMIWVAAIALLIVMLVTSVLVRWSVTPINELVIATGRVAGGDYTCKVSEGRQDEIGDLAESFNKMTADLKSSRDALVEKDLLEKLVIELRETQEQLVQAGKLAAVGQLAAGVAHEINNPLAGIMGYAQLLSEKMRRKQAEGLTPEEVPRYLSYVENMEKQSQRCKHIVQNLLKFARASSKEDMTLVDINHILRETISLVQHQMEASHITLVTDLQADLPNVMGHEGKMQQVFTNILINAMQAIDAEGNIATSTRVEGDAVVVRITDSGVGIRQENIDKIFEPFFTTKEIGKGTGLGLSVTYGLVRDMGGDINVESTFGVGSTFILTFPLTHSAAATPSPGPQAAEATSGNVPPMNSEA